MNRLPKTIRPFVSVVLIIATLFTIVFLQMEERRAGYVLLKMNHEQRALIDEKREREILLAKASRPQFVEQVAQRHLTLKKVSAAQIIHLSGEGLKLAQLTRDSKKAPQKRE